MTVAAVSPHLDDAALSASVRLGRGDATVLTVFTGLPPAGGSAGWWDRLTGASSSLDRQRERLAEDAAAMRLLSAASIHLGEPDAQYRRGDPNLSVATQRLAREFSHADEVWLPSAIGGHRDHRFARDAGLRAAVAAGHAQVTLYADFPYVIAYGWPPSVTGAVADPHLDVGFWLADQLASAGLDQAVLTPTVTRLSPGQRRLKAEIIGAYRTQAGALRLAPRDLAADPAKLDFELSWRMSL